MSATRASGAHLAEPSTRPLWKVAAWIGSLFLVVGAVESVPLWIPFSIGNVEWEIGTVSRFYDTVPTLALGLVFLLAAGKGLGWLWQVRLLAVLMLLVAVFMLLASALYLTDLPQTLRVMNQTGLALPLKKAIVKTGVQSIVYPVAFVWLSIVGLRRIQRAV